MSGTAVSGDQPIFYSFGTCSDGIPTTGESLAYLAATDSIATIGAGQMLQVAIPTMDFPIHFKRDASGAVVLGVEDDLYYDDSVPWEGSMINYMDAILSIAPYAAFNYTYTTPTSRVVFPDSKWTATVHDVQKRVVDIGGSDFWVTAERTGMVAFSASFSIDLICMTLWISNP